MGKEKEAEGQLTLEELFPDLWYGKMSREPSPPQAGKTSGRSWRKPAGWRTAAYLFLDLRPGAGNLLGPYWEVNSPSLGEYWTLNTGESPSEERGSSLWQILEECPPRKYYLSGKACRGILRRAAERGRKLPPVLQAALEAQAEWE